MDAIFRKLMRGPDPRGMAGIAARGNNIYRGGTPNATPKGVATNTKPKLTVQELARRRMGML
jgi:hypothetical protein